MINQHFKIINVDQLTQRGIWNTGVIVANNGPLYAHVDIPLHCISDKFDVILMDKAKDISK